MRNRPIKIIFEKVRLIHYPLIKCYLWKGYEVAVFQFTHYDEKPKWLLKMMAEDLVKRIYVPTVSKEEDLSIDQAEIIYNRLPNRRLSKIIAEFYARSEAETDLIFKRALLDRVYKCMYINSYLSYLQEEAEGFRKIYFIPDSYDFYRRIIAEYGSFNLKLELAVVIPLWTKALQVMARMANVFRAYFNLIGYVGFVTFLSVWGKFVSQKMPKPLHYKYAISLSNAFHIKFKGKRSFDFLLDHQSITKDNFFQAKEKSMLFNLLRFNIRSTFIGELLKVFGKMLVGGRCSDSCFIETFLSSLRAFIKRHLIFSQVSFDNYIFTNQESFQQIAFNIFLEKQGCKTWSYHSFIGAGVLGALDKNFTHKRQFYWAYLNNNYSVFFNGDVVRYNQLHRQQVGHYYAIGCIFSELIRENISQEEKINFVKKHFGQELRYQSKVISFFDTSFIPSEMAMVSYSDALNFYSDIIRLLNSRGNLFLIIKPSKSESWFISPHSLWASLDKGQKIIELWNILKSHPRVFWAGDNGDTSTIMAVSDLVVTHCMSSPTLEALGARKKAIWYESGNKRRGILYDQIPGLVVHGYKALEERVESLLYKVSDEEYDHYLNQYIKGKLEPYLDGKALTRFRNLLTEESENVVSN